MNRPTAVHYAILTGYDFLAFAYLGRHLPRMRVAMTSLLAYAISNSVGFAMLSGASIRYRFYTRWGISAEELSRIVFSYVVTFWLGLLLIGGMSLVLSPLPRELGLAVPAVVAPIGWLLVFASLGYVAAAVLRLGPIRFRRLELPLPSPWLAAAQLGISVLDWTVAGAVLYVLLPAGHVPFLALLGAFLASQLLGLASHVPGGLGVFEGLMVLFLKPFISSQTLLPALIAYRAVYYLLPLLIATLALVADEAHQRRAQAARLGAALGSLTEELTPRVLAVVAFVAGVVLLVSGATPAAAGRLRLIDRALPLSLIEVSQFAGSILGAALLLLSQALARRLDAAYVLTVVAIAGGIAASFLKGADYEEAVILGVILLVLMRARPAFDRRAALFDTRFSPGWIAAIVAALGTSLWLGFFAFRHVEYSNELWWQFELHGEASRMLRATVGASVAVPQRVELSVDLMRYDRSAPKEVMDALFVHLMSWGKAEGYRWFPLGMAPLSGFESSPVAPLWTRLASFVYAHGEAVYHFQGLRSFKEKFGPVWQPHYLASPGGLRLARILADVSALIAGGYRKIFLR